MAAAERPDTIVSDRLGHSSPSRWTPLLRDFLTAEQRAGALSDTTDPDTLAVTLITLLKGWAVLARAGTTRADLHASARAFVAGVTR